MNHRRPATWLILLQLLIALAIVVALGWFVGWVIRDVVDLNIRAYAAEPGVANVLRREAEALGAVGWLTSIFAIPSFAFVTFEALKSLTEGLAEPGPASEPDDDHDHDDDDDEKETADAA